MNRNVVIVLVGGMLIAILVAVLVQASLSGGKKEAPAEKAKSVAQVQIVVATKNLDVGSEITSNNVAWQSWPKDSVFPGAIVKEGDKKAADAASGRLRRNLAEGEPVTKTALVAEAEGNFLAATLDEGMRAVAVSIKAVSSAGGFVRPGDHVDVLLTYKTSIRSEDDSAIVTETIRSNLAKLATETILEDVKVMAVDQAITYDEDKKSKIGKTVTLEVDRKGAEALALAEAMGSISLSLRKLGDKSVLPDGVSSVSTDARLSRVDDEVKAEIARAKKASGADRNIVRIYNGNSVQELAVGH